MSFICAILITHAVLKLLNMHESIRIIGKSKKYESKNIKRLKAPGTYKCSSTMFWNAVQHLYAKYVPCQFTFNWEIY